MAIYKPYSRLAPSFCGVGTTLDLVSRLHYHANTGDSTANKGLLTAQAFPLSGESAQLRPAWLNAIMDDTLTSSLVEICSQHSCAVAQHQYTTTHILANYNTFCSVLLYKHADSSLVRLLSNTPVEICFPYSSNTNAVQHSFWQTATPTAQWSSANQADSSLVALQIHLWRFALHTSVHSPNTKALQQKEVNCNTHCSGLLCKPG